MYIVNTARYYLSVGCLLTLGIKNHASIDLVCNKTNYFVVLVAATTHLLSVHFAYFLLVDRGATHILNLLFCGFEREIGLLHIVY